ncbi:MAG: phosphopantothenoylcysteine decarboxylase, partial [Nitrosarchaeum sp.]
IKLVRVETSQEMFDAVKKELKQKFNIVILAAAVSDYIPEKPRSTKTKSDLDKIIVKLKRAPKIIDQIKKIQKNVFLVGFKAETNLPKGKLIMKARNKLKESNADLIVANDIGSKYKNNTEYNSLIVVNSKISYSGRMKKLDLVKFLRKEIEKRI